MQGVAYKLARLVTLLRRVDHEGAVLLFQAQVPAQLANHADAVGRRHRVEHDHQDILEQARLLVGWRVIVRLDHRNASPLDILPIDPVG